MKLKKIAKDLILERGNDGALKWCDTNIEFYQKFHGADKEAFIMMWKEIKRNIENGHTGIYDGLNFKP